MSRAYGYAGKILRVDLTTWAISTVPTDSYSKKFLGGRGIAARIHWDEVPPDIHPFDPENRLVFMTGPVCGVPGFSGSRWQVSGKSPSNNSFTYCNLGGSWGAQLKFAGYDGLIVHGKADKLRYLLIDDEKVSLINASALKGKGAIDTREMIKEELGKSFRVVAIGPAGENRVAFATLTADMDSSGSAGLGSVMGSKNLKAIVVRGQGKIEIADNEKIKLLRKNIKKIKLKIGPESWPTSLPQERIKKEICFGCISGCIRSAYSAENGSVGKYICQSAFFYEARAQRYYGEITEVPFHANKMCDNLGLDTRAVETMIMWLSRCHKSNTLDEEGTGLPLSKMGSLEFIEVLLNKIAFREGFGDILAEGTVKAAETVGQDSKRFITDYMINTGENSVYDPRLYLTTGLFYAMEPRMPIQQLHEISIIGMAWAWNKQGYADNFMTSDVVKAIAKRFWGSEAAADFSTIDGKAKAAAIIQDREFAKESMILCDLAWPINQSEETHDHVGDPTLESQLCSAVTGLDIDEQGLYEIGERVFNLQRAILVREGQKGREYDKIGEFNYTVPLKGDFGNPECIVPGPDGETFPRKGLVLDKNDFEKMKDEFYQLRGWDVATGLQTREKLETLNLKDVADQLEKEGVLAG